MIKISKSSNCTTDMSRIAARTSGGIKALCKKSCLCSHFWRAPLTPLMPCLAAPFASVYRRWESSWRLCTEIDAHIARRKYLGNRTPVALSCNPSYTHILQVVTPCCPAGIVSPVPETTNIAFLACILVMVSSQGPLKSAAQPALLAWVAGRDETVFLLVEE